MIRVSFIPSLFYIIGFINNSTLISSMRLSFFFSNSTSLKLTYSTIFTEKNISYWWRHFAKVELNCIFFFLLNSFFWYHWKSWSCPFNIENFLSFFSIRIKGKFHCFIFIFTFYYYTYAPFSSALKISKKEFRFIGINLTEFLIIKCTRKLLTSVQSITHVNNSINSLSLSLWLCCHWQQRKYYSFI